MKIAHIVAFILLVVGGLNWGLAVFNINLVEMLLGSGVLAKTVYGLVGLSAVFLLVTHKGDCKTCAAAPAQM